MKKLLALFLAAAMTLGVVGCGGNTEPEASPEPQSEETETTEGAEEEPQGAGESVAVNIYFGDEMADHILSKETQLPKLDANLLLEQITKNGSIPEKITANECIQDGKNMLQLDLAAPFTETVQSMGTAGEHIIIYSIVNTFLKAYEADSILLTVDGKPLETGHNVYDYPLEFYTEEPAE